MKNHSRFNFIRIGIYLFLLSLSVNCNSSEVEKFNLEEYLNENGLLDDQSSASEGSSSGATTSSSSSVTSNFLLPDIDLNHWKVTLPIDNANSIKPPEILNYATNEYLKPFFYNDSIDGSLNFYAYPAETTPNSTYSRTELREQMISGSDRTNWSFAQGGSLRGVLAVSEVSQDQNGNPHRLIVMQIHGRLTDDQKERIGQKDNNAPPILKIYWQDGKIRVKTKELKDVTTSDDAVLYSNAWTDDEGFTFPDPVDFDKFTLEVNVKAGLMEVILNNYDTIRYSGVHIDKWGAFDNYFKAGNYFQSRDEGSFARVKYYELEVSHD